MSEFLEKDHVRGLAYALQIVLGDEYFDEEIQTSVSEMMEQWADSPSFARSTTDACGGGAWEIGIGDGVHDRKGAEAPNPGEPQRLAKGRLG